MSATASKPIVSDSENGWELERPERSAIDLALALMIGLATVVWLKPFLDFNKLGSDEGVALQGAARILRGEVPYRDFFAFYTPGCYYLYAALFKLFGVSIRVAHAWLLGYAALFSSLTYLLARRGSSRPLSALAACLLGLICLPSRFENLHSWDSTAMAMLALYSAVWSLQRESRLWLFLAGIFTGCTAMIEQTRGAGMVLGLLLAGLVLHRGAPERWRIRTFMPAVLGSLLPVVTVVAYFAGAHALRPMFAGWFWPLNHYTTANKLPFGYMVWTQAHIFGSTSPLVQLVFAVAISAMIVVSLLPLLVSSLGVFKAGQVLFFKEPLRPLNAFAILAGCAAFGNLIAAFLTHRPDYWRMVYTAPLVFFALPLLLDQRLVRLPTLHKMQPLIAIWLIIAFLECSGLLREAASSPAQVYSTRRGTIRTDADELVPYMISHTTAGESVLVYPYSAMYSFLTATFSPTRYDFMQPGMHTAAQFEEARQQLEADKTAVVVFDVTFHDLISRIWPSTPAESLASDPLGDYVLSHYRSCKVLQSRKRAFLYMVRKDLPCPRD